MDDVNYVDASPKYYDLVGSSPVAVTKALFTAEALATAKGHCPAPISSAPNFLAHL